MCTVLPPPGVNPIAVNNMYNIISYTVIQAYTLCSALCDDHERSGTDQQGGGPGPLLLDLLPRYRRIRGKTWKMSITA
jgi:hypothetical protein